MTNETKDPRWDALESCTCPRCMLLKELRAQVEQQASKLHDTLLNRDYYADRAREQEATIEQQAGEIAELNDEIDSITRSYTLIEEERDRLKAELAALKLKWQTGILPPIPFKPVTVGKTPIWFRHPDNCGKETDRWAGPLVPPEDKK